MPTAVGVYVTEHDEVGAGPGERVQGLPEKAPVPLEEKVTVPDGEVLLPLLVSVTVAVQVEPWFNATGEEHDTTVLVERPVFVALNVTVTLCVLLPMLKLHVVPEHEMPEVGELQLTNEELPPAVAASAPMSVLPTATVHVAVQDVFFVESVVSVT